MKLFKFFKLSEAADALRDWARAKISANDADALLSAVANCDSAAVMAGSLPALQAEDAARFRDLVLRRARGEPLAYLIGAREFWSMRLEVNRDVLIPRDDTETLVECALAFAKRNQVKNILELGTGSGAVALALAHELQCDITATDSSAAALQVALRNCKRQFAKDARIKFLCGDWFSPVAGKFDLIISNPPYIAPNDIHLLRGDLRFEPQLALVARQNGLSALIKIIRGGHEFLRGGGGLFLEHGEGQGAAVRALFMRNNFREIKTCRDLSGHERVSGGVINTAA